MIRFRCLSDRAVSTSYTEHFMELNRCTIGEFRQIVKDLDFEVVDLRLMPVRNKEFLTKTPLFGKFFVHVVQAALSKTDASPPKSGTHRSANVESSAASSV